MGGLQNILWVGLGGFAGAIMRYLVSGWIQRLSIRQDFPLGTLGVNIAGCLVIGLLGGLADRLEVFTPNTRLLVFIGVLGSFTTFSTFGYETMALLRDRNILLAITYVSLHLILGFGAVWGGYALSSLR